MAAKKTMSAMDFIVAQLQKNKSASYAEIKQAADTKKLAVYPIMYGRAQAMLGIVKAKPRGQGKAAVRKKKAAAAAAGAAPARRGPGRPRESPQPVGATSLEGIIAAVKTSEQDKARYRDALEKIHDIIGSILN